MRFIKAILFTLFMGIIALSQPAASAKAATLDVVGGELVGAKNVDIDVLGIFGGSLGLFDVSFEVGSCVEVYTGCDAPGDFDFSDSSFATFAGLALLDQVFIDGPQGNFDSDIGRIRGCAANCISIIPFALNPILPTTNFPSGTAIFTLNGPTENLDVPVTLDFFVNGEAAGGGSYNFARFTPAAPILPPPNPIPPPPAPIPVPAALPLFLGALAGLGGLGFMKRRKKCQAEA